MVDRNGLTLIKVFEDFSPTAYQDQKGIWTIGFGHTLGVTKDTLPITEEVADGLLDEDLLEAEHAVDTLVKVPLTQNEYNALVSFVFNEGYGNFKSSTLLKKLNQGDRPGAGKEFLRWIYYSDPITKAKRISNGLLARRQKEYEVFMGDIQAKKDDADAV